MAKRRRPEDARVPEEGIAERQVDPQEAVAESPPLAEPSPVPNLDWMFDYHKSSEDQVDKYNQISDAAKNLVKIISNTCPVCADRTDAIRKVREARMTANASIALHGAV